MDDDGAKACTYKETTPSCLCVTKTIVCEQASLRVAVCSTEKEPPQAETSQNKQQAEFGSSSNETHLVEARQGSVSRGGLSAVRE